MELLFGNNITMSLPYNVERVLNFKMNNTVGQHVSVLITGTVSSYAVMDQVSRCDDITVKIDDQIVFCGYTVSAAVNGFVGQYRIVIQGMSHTRKMRIQRKRRTFQNKSIREIASQITGEYKGKVVLEDQNATLNRKSNYAQYDETDWDFICRIAREAKFVVTVDATHPEPWVCIGMPMGVKTEEVEFKNSNSYIWDIKRFSTMSLKATQDTETSGKTSPILKLGDYVRIKDRATLVDTVYQVSNVRYRTENNKVIADYDYMKKEESQEFYSRFFYEATSKSYDADRRLRGWDIVESIDSEWSGLVATVYKRKGVVLVVFKGSDNDQGYNDWILSNLSAIIPHLISKLSPVTVNFGFINHAQGWQVDNLMERLLEQYPTAEFCIAGHSLGGYLTLRAASKMSAMNQGNRLKRADVFNGYGLLQQDNKKPMKKIKDKVHSYSMEGDAVSEFGELYNEQIFPTNNKGIKASHEISQFDKHFSYFTRDGSAPFTPSLQEEMFHGETNAHAKIRKQLMQGLVLTGKVIAVEHGRVKVHFDCDEKQEIGDAYAFPIVEPYIGGNGVGFFQMPNVGDRVEVQFGRFNFESGNIRSVIRAAPEENKKLQPPVKGISNDTKKEITLDEKSINMKAGEDSSKVKLHEEKGLSVSSNLNINLKSLEGPIIMKSDVIQLKSMDAIYMKGVQSSIVLMPDGIHFKSNMVNKKK